MVYNRNNLFLVKKRWGSKGNNKEKDIGKHNGLKMKEGIG